MQKRSWIFPAITFLLLANGVLGNQSRIGMLLLLLWFLRIVLLRDQQIIREIVLLSIFFLSIIFMHQEKNQTSLNGEEQFFILDTELSSIKIDGDALSFKGTIVKNEQQDLKEKVAVRYYLKTEAEKEKWSTLKVPSHLKVTGALHVPSSNTNFNQFNYQAYLQRKKIHWQLNAEEIDWLEDARLKKSFFYQVDDVRYRVLRYMDRIFHEQISSYLKILFLADGTALTEATKGSYRALGLIHLFSISGFHISYLAKAFQRLFLRIGITHERANLLLVVILPLYGLLAGLSISVFRAVCQRTLLLVSAIFERELSTTDAWALAMIASLIINPYHLFEVSFQLSYSLSGLFILIGQQEWIKELPFLKQNLLFSFLSFLVSLPLLSYHFYEIPWIAILTNLLFVPFFTYVLFPGLAFLFLISFILSNTYLFIFLNEILAFILDYVEVFLFNLTEQLDFSFIIGRLPQIVFVILVVCVLHILKEIEQKNRPSTFIGLCLLLSISWNRLSPVGYVLVIDVGQGDSILVKEPGTRKTTLIDTGGEIEWQTKEKWRERESPFTIGQDIVVPSLKSLGIARIDRLYITHAHEDHMGEIANIDQELPITEVAATRCTLQSEQMIRQLIPLKESKMVEVKPTAELAYPTVKTVALHPLKNYESKNDQSLVLYVKMGDDNWLFTGDMEEAAEKDLLQTWPTLPVDYLKVAHHGSNTSSTREFIEHIQPETALISVGKKNRYGHPNVEVLELLTEKKVTTYSTAENGAIKVSYFKIPFLNKWRIKSEIIK